MFDLPSAKRVRRDEVRSTESSRSASPVDESDFQDAHARLGKLLNLDGLLQEDGSSKGATDAPPPTSDEKEDEEQEFEFRLFSAPAKPKDSIPSREDAADQPASKKPTGDEKKEPSGTQKLRIRLRSPTPGAGGSEGRFVKSFRGWQYYFSTPSLYDPKEKNVSTEQYESERRRQFEDMAITGEHVLGLPKSQPWPGCNLPWRVIHLKRHQTKLPPKSTDVPVYVVEGALPSKSPKTRKKPGKKRRVQLRKRQAAAIAAQVEEAEKRTRKNRERKMKRRQKAREQKAAAGGGDVAIADADNSSAGED
ncbi:hypothetical protein N7468_007297 [Penicillium chermesinum]|uniref:Uncharacterized protein n=1 Tax=Penicillium chermesinum TaxID=63820 RepID=A0A9W9NTX1_9EURO|nr:uncharacterized protein N7468_007297 [Penicillium chermesinum]KAJ5226072.1 hypothetical protein N7468_007297 [Penicillium chermesinum]KAJ6160737.1 hypothetical protein N7470_004133 [Penicillium chermesinum]